MGKTVAKTSPAARSELVDQYLQDFPPEVQARMIVIREAVHELIPDVTETISYRMPTFVLNKTYVVHFAGYERHLGFYPTPSGIMAFADEIAGFKNAKGSVQFPHNQPLPMDLIRRIIAFRRDEVSR